MVSVLNGTGANITSDTTHIAYINPIRYRSYYYDVETGLYYLQSRYYDPAIGRFISADVLLINSPEVYGNNLFSYGANNPIKYFDPSGYCIHLLPCGGAEWVACDIPDSPGVLRCYNYTETQLADFGFAGCKPFYNEQIELNQEQKVFVSTVAAEALNYGTTSQRAVADVITNRTSDTVSVTDVITAPYQFSGYGDHNYNACMSYLNSRDGSMQIYEDLISSVIFIYFNGSNIAQGSTLYYSPRSMKNGNAPADWNFSLLDEVFIPGIDSYNFRFYKYRR